MRLASGMKLGPYEILAPLGAGGMGEVYRARDTRLAREVAVKVLPAGFVADADRLRRFEQEARSASALNHPNIVTIHDVGTQDGAPYVVWELLEGETLRQRLASGALPVRKVVDYGLQIARGLAAAHEKGIVHRDLKPENLFITRDERVKILDFGLAKAVTAAASVAGETAVPTEPPGTEPGMVMGTIGYMSPEQVRGQAVDQRSDVFALGAILYEMASGRRAFQGETAADSLASILYDDPPSAGDAGRNGVSLAIERVARRCLEKEPGQRFQVACDVSFALELFQEGPGPSSGVAPESGTRPSGERTRAVAVLPFKNLVPGEENAHLSLGLADATITELALIRSLLVRPTAAILRYRDRPVEPQQAARELGVDAVVDGSIQSVGSRLRVTVQLIATADGRSLWGTKIDSSLEDLFGMQDQVSRRIVEALRLELTPSDEQRLAHVPRVSGRAYELYLQGRNHLLSQTRLPSITAAIECFEKARETDPDSPLPMIGLADACARMAFSFDPEGDWYVRAEEWCDRALATARDLPEGHYLRGRLLWHPRRGFDHGGALRELMAASTAKPNFAEAHHWSAMVLNHVGLLEQSIAAFDRALAIDPQDEYARAERGLTRYLQGEYDEAIEISQAATQHAASAWAWYLAAQCHLRLGHREQAAEAAKRLSDEYPDNVLVPCVRGLLAARLGRADEALDFVEATARSRRSFGHFHHAQSDIACIHALLGRTDAALDWLDQAARNGFPCLPFFEKDPFLESIRGTSGFGDLAARLRREGEEHRRLYDELTIDGIRTDGAAGGSM
jgi:serine/threonine protein kinase/tetratricopeptide (TPR) repeat protein